MSCSLSLKGNIVIGDSSCGGSCGGSNGSSQKITPLSLGCGVSYGAISSTDCPIAISTTGSLGSEYVQLPGLSGISEILFLYVKSSSSVWLLLDGMAAEMQFSGGTYPTGFSGGEAFDFDIDNVNVSGTFTAAAQSLTQVITELNQAAIAVGLPYLPFSESSNQLKITGSIIGSNGAIDMNSVPAELGSPLQDSVSGAGEIIKINGTAMLQFDSSTAPKNIFISGVASVEVTAAGAA